MKIGVFDSGLGGLSVFKHLKRAISAAQFIYVADSAHAPYGTKTDAYILERSKEISLFLLDQDVSAIVIACNTATAAAVKYVREMSHVPVIAIEPGIKPAAQMTRSGSIGVLATASTINSPKYKQLTANFISGIECIHQPASGLVEQVESGLFDDEYTQKLLAEYLQPMLNNNADVIVLGCTHYPFLKKQIHDLVGDQVSVIDTGKAVTEQLQRVLKTQLPSTQEPAEDIFYTSGDLDCAETVVQKLLVKPVKFQLLTV